MTAESKPYDVVGHMPDKPPGASPDECLVRVRRVLNDPTTVTPRHLYESLSEWQARALWMAGLLRQDYPVTGRGGPDA